MHVSMDVESLLTRRVSNVVVNTSDDHPLGTMDLAPDWTVCTTNTNRLSE